jgi:hypothetical protein
VVILLPLSSEKEFLETEMLSWPTETGLVWRKRGNTDEKAMRQLERL